MIISTDITRGMAPRGAVAHVVKGVGTFGLPVSYCGRWVTAGECVDVRLCRTCVRIGKIVEVKPIETNEARTLIAECACNNNGKHMTPEGFIASRINGAKFTAFEISIFRDVVEDYTTTQESDWLCWVGTCAILVKDPKLTQEIKPVESTCKRSTGGGNVIDPKNAKPARKRGHGASDKQEALIRNLISQIAEHDKEAADVLSSIHTDAWMNDTVWAKISDGIKSLFRILDTVKASTARKAKETESAKPTREWVKGSVYVIDGVFHRVHVSKTSGRAYTQSWSEENGWDYQGMKFLPKCTDDNKITAELAAKWGHEHDWCVFCSRELDDERSRNAGYGPTCADKHGLPWGE